MADWTEQDPNTLLPGEPWTSAKALAAFENPVAITEGAADAPRLRARALSPVGGLFFGVAAFGTSGGDYTATGLDGATVFYLSGNAFASAGLAFNIAFSTNDGVSFGSFQTVGLVGATDVSAFGAVVDMTAGEVSFISASGDPALPTSGTASVTVPSGTNAFRLQLSGAGSGNVTALVFAIGGTDTA